MATRTRDVQMHAVIHEPDANGGPGPAKLELDADLLNLVWQSALNFPAQAAFTLTRYNPKLAQLDYMRDHIKIYREDSRATKCVFSGKVIKPQASAGDILVFCWDYVSFLQRSRTGYKVLYPSKKIGTEIVLPEWNLAKGVGTSPFAFVANGTVEDPLALDGVTPIQTNSQFGVIDFDRLYTFYAMAELSMANTQNTVVFEITREAPHTFNFWKNRSAARTNYHFSFPGNLIDYDMADAHDQIVNDMATVIVDSTTGVDTEYALTDGASIALYRRLQTATAIKTLYGLNATTTETDQQKAALARLITLSSTPPSLFTLFPRQGELTPFDNFDLGDTMRVTLQKADRSGDDVDDYKRLTGISAAWTPEAGELLQVFLR